MKYLEYSRFLSDQGHFLLILPNARLASRVTVDSQAISILDKVKFLYRSKNHSLYCTECFQTVWFQGLSSSSITSIGPDLQGIQLVTFTSRCWDIPSGWKKTVSTQNYNKKGVCSSNHYDCMLDFNLCMLHVYSLMIYASLTFSLAVRNMFL